MINTLILIGEGTRPERTKPNESKDEQYHLENGRWCVYHANNNKHNEHQKNITINRNFYSPNKQWTVEEDFNNFLMDTSGQTNNRIKVEMNYIQIMGNQYVGNVCNMGVRSRCVPMNPLAKEREKDELNKSLMWNDVMKSASPEVNAMVQANQNVGQTEEETISIFGNTYVDKFVKGVNGLLKYGEVVNNVELMKKEVAESIVISGMAVIKPEVSSREYRYKLVQPERFFWDREARRYDLSDAAYMGEVEQVMLTEIYERCHMASDSVKRQIEEFKSSLSGSSHSKPDRLILLHVYWRDISMDRWGYVEDEFGDLVFDRIDYTFENEEKPRYKMSDVVALSKLNTYQKKVVGNGIDGKGAKLTFTDQWRYVEFVPREQLGALVGVNNKDTKDLVLEYGIVPYQEPNVYSPFNMESPYKVGFYIYTDGYVYSPLDIAINPQRVANRLMSVVENIMNNSHGSGSIIAKESVDKSGMSAAQLQLKMKRNEPIVVPAAAFGGVQNAVGKYDSNIGQGAASFLETANIFLQTIEKITGVNEAMKGQMERPDQLVGTMQLMIKKGTVVTERYYSAVRELFRQVYQAMATSGKRFYVNEKPKLTALIGDEESEIIQLTKEMSWENHRVFVDLTPDQQTERQYIDVMLMQFLQMGLMDKGRFSLLIGRASLDDMWYALRESTKEIMEAERQASQMAMQDMEQEQQQGEQMVQETFNQKNADRDAKLMETMLKSQGQASM
jgi:hypothetical protein